MTSTTHLALADTMQDLASEVDEHHTVRSYVVVWDHPLGFVLNVDPADRAEMAQRLRDFADSIEREPA